MYFPPSDGGDRSTLDRLFFMITSFFMDGMPPPSSDEFDPELVARCIWPQPMAHEGCLSFLVREGLCVSYQLEPIRGDRLFYLHFPGVHADSLYFL